MGLFEENNLLLIEGKRYYFFDLNVKFPSLKHSKPYKFEYNDISIEESSWMKLSMLISQELQKRYPRDLSFYINIKNPWNNEPIFSVTKRTICPPLENLYFIDNYTIPQNLMNIQAVLLAFDIKLEDCKLIIERKPIVEPKPIREYFIATRKIEFFDFLIHDGINEERAKKILNNMEIVNKLLLYLRRSCDNLYLFEDYAVFCQYKPQIIQKASQLYTNNRVQNVELTKKYLDYFDSYLKERDSYKKLSCGKGTIDKILALIENEIGDLMKFMHTPVIVAAKLFARMNIKHKELMAQLFEFNNKKSLYLIMQANLSEKYLFNYPYISNLNKDFNSVEDILADHTNEFNTFKLSDLNKFADKMLLSKNYNIQDFINKISSSFIQISDEEFMRNDLIDIDTFTITKIKNELAFYIKSFGDIDSTTYAGYSSLPPIKYKWNKYILAGIIKLYLFNSFKVDFTTIKQTSMDYIISIIKE